MKKTDCKKVVISNEDVKVCIPVMGGNKEEILNSLESVVKMSPDIIEWRADFFKPEKLSDYENVLSDMKDVLDDIPLIFTFRTLKEGGNKDITWEQYCSLCEYISKIGDMYNVIFIDIEIFQNKEYASCLIKKIHSNNMKVIGSNHHFDMTPGTGEMTDILKYIEKSGADICKLAVMPLDKEDVKKLIETSKIADKELKVPVITISMGELGAVTRVVPYITKSVITFAAGDNASAPGQPDIKIVRRLLRENKNCTIKGDIAIIGFMGTGKTTISNTLSMITGLKEVDVDRYIVEKEGMEISEIFEKYGEEYFRKSETKALREIACKEGQIISCGGGAVLRDENVKILKENGTVILLTASPETIFDRVKDHTHRPILNNDMSLEHVKSLMAEREPRYQSVADIKINVDSNDRVLTCYNMLCGLEEKG